MTHHDSSPASPYAPGMLTLAVLVFLQMLPATMLTPAIRPLFATLHHGNEHAMHAFMAINMLGALVTVPFIGAWAQRSARPHHIIAGLIAADAVLLGVMPHPMSTRVLLILRLCEGAAHVSATALLLAQIAALGRARGEGRVMGVAGAALMFAVAFGSGLGGQLVGINAGMPFWVGSALQLGTLFLLLSLRMPVLTTALQPPLRPIAVLRELPGLRVPVAATFVGRFTVGCIVVTFALFVHHHHGGSDRSVGLLFMLLTLPFALAMYPLSRLSDRVPRATLMAVGGLIYSLCLVSVAFVPFSVLPVVMVGAGVSSAALFAPSLCYGASLGGTRKEMAMSLINAAGCLGMILGPAVSGVASALLGNTDAVLGYRAAFIIAAASVFLWLTLSLRWLIKQAHEETLCPRSTIGVIR